MGVLSLDAEKAFDRVETSYLLQLLQRMDFGLGFVQTIRSLHDNPSAYVSVNNHCSEEFKLTRGICQVALYPRFFLIFPSNRWQRPLDLIQIFLG